MGHGEDPKLSGFLCPDLLILEMKLREGRDFPKVTQWLAQSQDGHSGMFSPYLGRQTPDTLSWAQSLKTLVYPFMPQTGKQRREGT